jgi:L-fucose mutarotase/ribose pyranase (RbsD/FucU family)
LRLDIAASEKADAIARLLTLDQADEEQLTAATEVAQAQLELLRIRAVRAELMSAVELASGNLPHLQRLAALDRYERFAHTKRRRASRKLQVPDIGG